MLCIDTHSYFTCKNFQIAAFGFKLGLPQAKVKCKSYENPGMLSGLVSRAVRVERCNALLNAIHVFPFILAILLLACAALMTHFQNNSTAPPVHRLLVSQVGCLKEKVIYQRSLWRGLCHAVNMDLISHHINEDMFSKR